MNEPQILTLSNGIRVAHRQVSNSNLVHCGYVLDIGSRDESPMQQGIAHFWEHMAFKGTKKRKAYHIINRLDSLGGELNAFTTKEKICFYGTALNQHTEKAIDLLTDITFDSVFPENQIEKERSVILEEMAMYEDDPEDSIQDEFDQLLFRQHPLAHNILGTDKTVRTFQRHDFELFVRQHLDTSRLILSCVSNWPAKRIFKLAEKYLDPVKTRTGAPRKESGIEYIPGTRVKKRDITQAHCAMGRPAYNIHSDQRLAFMMLTNLLGGPAMNSRLNLALRERHGYVYGIDASYSAYTDTGMFAVYFATDKKRMHRSIELVLKELRKLKNKRLSTVQLHKSKEQFIGQMAMSEENNAGFMLMMGRSLIDHDHIPAFGEIAEKIRSITASDLMDICNEIFEEDKFSFLYYVPQTKSA
jgi:predicted Zn-dependent peptidase